MCQEHRNRNRWLVLGPRPPDLRLAFGPRMWSLQSRCSESSPRHSFPALLSPRCPALLCAQVSLANFILTRKESQLGSCQRKLLGVWWVYEFDFSCKDGVCFSKCICLVVLIDCRNSTCWQKVFLKVIKIKTGPSRST